MLVQDVGQPAEALAAVQEALRTVEEHAPEQGHYIADLQVWLGRLRIEASVPSAAEPALRAALAYRESSLPADHPKVAEARCVLGIALAAQGRRAEAEPLLRSGLPVFAEWGLANRSLVARAQQALANGQ